MVEGRLTCGICGRPVLATKAVVLKLTVAERQALQQDGQEPPLECVYCRPCHRVLSDPTTGLSVIKGIIQLRLRQLGVENSEALASDFQQKLAGLTAKNQKKPS